MDAFAQYGITTDLLEEAFPFFIACDRDLRITMLGRSIKQTCKDVAIGSRLVEFVKVFHDISAAEIRSPESANQVDKYVNQTVSVQWFSTSLQLRGRMSCRNHGYLFLVSPNNQECCGHDFDLSISDSAPQTETNQDAAKLHADVAQPIATSHYELKKLVLRLERAAREKEQRHMAEKSLIDDLKAAGDLCVHFDAQRTIIDIKVACQDYIGTHPIRLSSQPLATALPSVHKAIDQATESLESGQQRVGISFQLVSETTDYHFDARLAKANNGDYVLLARDITERCHLEERLEHRTLHDPLTGLANRKQFQLNALHAIEHGKNIAILLADIDDFKSINDSLGEDYGDAILRVLGERVLCFTRDSDTAFRIGADEFGILLSSDCPLEFAESVAHRLTKELCKPIVVNDIEVEPHVSIGLAIGGIGQSFDATMRDAGFALERAKGQRKSSIVVCDDAVRDQLQERSTMKREIARAVRQREFVSLYQPIVDLQSKRIIGFEALVRWDHPTRGMLSPFYFLDIAEETGDIVEIGEIMLETACRDFQELGTLFPGMPLKVNVNLASQQVQDLRLLSVINDTLRKTKLDPKHLTLEITETALIHDFDKAKRVICNVREQGIQVALDDFGAGHSSLTYLQQLPIDYLKLDRALISSVCESDSQRAITECVTRLGKALDLQVVAEGIETEAQHQLVTQLGCDMAQGFLFSKPVLLDQAIELLVSELAFGPSSADQANAMLPTDRQALSQGTPS